MAEEVLSTEWVDPATGQKMNTTRLSGTIDPAGNLAGNTIAGDNAPTELVIPQINAVDTSRVFASTVGLIYYAGFIINPLDDTVAAQRFIDGDFTPLNPGEIAIKQSGSVITDVYVVSFGSVYNAGGVLLSSGDTLAHALLEQNHFTFDSTDNVKKIQITASPLLETSTEIEVTLQGAKYV